MQLCPLCRVRELSDNGHSCDECAGEGFLRWLADRKKFEVSPEAAAKFARRCAAGQKAADRRRITHPHMFRPATAAEFWQRTAMSMVAKAKAQGLLPALDGAIGCADCDRPAFVYDHRDYSRPLDVVPVCESCNRKRGTAIWPTAADYNFKRIEHN